MITVGTVKLLTAVITISVVLHGPLARNGASATDVQLQIRRCDRALALESNEEGYQTAITAAKLIRDAGVSRESPEVEARGLARMALVQLMFAKWGDEWEGWLKRADEITQRSKSPSMARAEFLMVDGYLKAMYLGQPREGVAELEAAIVVAKALEDDVLFAQVFRYLSAVAAFDGQLRARDPLLYRSALFAARAENKVEEFTSRYRLLVVQHSRRRAVDEANRMRVRELGHQLGLGDTVADDQQGRLRHQEKIVDKYLHLLDSNDLERPHSLSALLQGATDLSRYHADEGRWQDSERHLEIAKRAAEILQDESTAQDLLEHEAVLLAKDGKGAEALQVIQPIVHSLEKLNNSERLASLYGRLAGFLEQGEDRESALKCLKLASRSRDLQQFESMEQTERTAAAYVNEIVQTRELTRKIRAREEELDRTLLATRILLVALPLLLACGYQYQRSRRQQSIERELKAQVDRQTASLRRAKEEAETANRAKTDFIARINHELRNPLAAILSSIELFSHTDGSELESIRQTIHSCSVNLLDTVDDVLDFTKIESGKLELHEREFSPKELLQVVSDIVRPCMSADTELEVTMPATYRRGYALTKASCVKSSST